MTNRCLLGAGVALAMAFGGAQAHAQSAWWPTGTPYGWYIGPEGGWTSLTSTNNGTVTGAQFQGGPGGATTFTFPGTANPTRNFDAGFNVGARGGVQWGPWRLEEEYSYRHNNLSSFTSPLNGFTTSGAHGSGQDTSHAIMTNLIYDFGTWGWNWGFPITPHIGAGIGAVDVITNASINSFTLPNSIGAPVIPATPLSVQGPQTFGGTLVHGSGWRFGYQAIAGLRFDFSPSVAFDLDYRYLGTTDQTTTNNARFPLPGGILPNGTSGTNCCANTRFTSSYHAQNVVASITMKFGAPPAPPPPLPPAAPPPPAQKVFLVFFDWDKYNITAEGDRIIQLAAQQYKAGGSVKLQVTGYTDTTGSYAYNQRLSERRANAVATKLVAYGVARSDMSVAGRSFNDLRVPTPPGVREPQNRRVEILFP
jgi:OmpA-OmpF porin, OOP family